MVEPGGVVVVEVEWWRCFFNLYLFRVGSLRARLSLAGTP